MISLRDGWDRIASGGPDRVNSPFQRAATRAVERG